ncbi:DUF123 domain-containing protein [Evansella sp. AB-rgal1]|uniref:GIY-YIG nuclease family protein n=1 Tax=Evansella sp. AB-rgal1 TaxID=3242696 RepID=UPI00359D67F7
MLSKCVKDIPDTDQLYVIMMNLLEDRHVAIGKLGSFLFHKGTYIYVGSAKKNIQARVKRHINKEKPTRRWHIDFFSSNTSVIGFITFPHHKGECQLKDFIQKQFHGTVVAKGLGSSDCSCDSHLLKINDVDNDIDKLCLLQEWSEQ